MLGTVTLAPSFAFAEETKSATDDIEVIQVKGIRGSQVASINTKRMASSVVDGISSEDIGKLPDVTIADSLQRITGVQIRRSAGEGGAVNVRGLGQVTTQINGEQYLSAGNVVSAQPNFGDIPSQLFKGADVYKSAPTNIGNAGITGTINLKTYRPFDFDDGMTFAGSAEVQRGSETKETDPNVSGLFAMNEENWGFLISATLADVNLSNSYNGINTGSPGDTGWGQSTTIDNKYFTTAQGFSAWNQETERERTGVNASFQADLGEGFEFIVDIFHTKQDEYNRIQGMSATNKWQGEQYIFPSDLEGTGADIDGAEFNTWTQATLSPRRVKSFTQNDSFYSASNNINLELNYDNGGAFTGNFRAVIGKASRKKRHGYNEGDLTNGQSTLNKTEVFMPSDKCRAEDRVAGDLGGCFQAINPLGYSEDPTITLDNSGEHPTYGGFDNTVAGGLGNGATLADYMRNLGSYNVGAFSSENNENASADLQVFSLKGNYALDDGFITSVDVGIRSSSRTTEFERYHLFSPFHNKGCEAQWKATDVDLGNSACADGENVNGAFQPYAVLGNVALDQFNDVNFVTDFGPVNGIPGVWAADPKNYDDPEAFHNRVFGSTTKAVVPGRSFSVDLDELTYYVQANFEHNDFSGNFGIKVIETDLSITQNLTGKSKPYGNTNIDVGDKLTKRSYTDYLPAVNVAYQASDDVVIRFSYTENMMAINLDQWGDGLSLSTALDSNPASETNGQFIVTSGTANGNPALEPWRSDNVDFSAEWYLGAASMLSVGYFYIDVESFTENQTQMQFHPDADGIVRRQVPISLNGQGDGASLEGLELAAKLSFSDFIEDDTLLSKFGIDTNYTFSPSETDSEDIYGQANLFTDNSEHQFNLATWYEDDNFQARIAYNYRSERLSGLNGYAGKLNVYQDAVGYLDISASYDVNENITVYVNGSNITSEFEEYYAEEKRQRVSQNFYEARYTVGVRAKF